MCVHASSGAKQPMAIIFPHEQNLRHALQSGLVPGINPADHLQIICHDKRVVDLVLRDCIAIGKKNGFKPMELLQAVVLTADEWTPESGLVTAAQKVQRKKVAQHYEKEIKVCV